MPRAYVRSTGQLSRCRIGCVPLGHAVTVSPGSTGIAAVLSDGGHHDGWDVVGDDVAVNQRSVAPESGEPRLRMVTDPTHPEQTSAFGVTFG